MTGTITRALLAPRWARGQQPVLNEYSRVDPCDLLGQTVHVIAGSIAKMAVGVVAGASLWTATEYGTHRWVLHGPFGKGRLSKVPLGGVHRTHHRDPLRTTVVGRTAGHIAVAGAAAVVSTGLPSIVPAMVARSAAAAFAGGYSTYELTHWSLHHRQARTRHGQYLRDRHERHHFGAPASNLGVTMTFWDKLLGTEVATTPATRVDE